MESGRLMFSSATPCRAGGGQMMLFGGSGSFLGGSPAVSGVEDGRRRKRPFLATTMDDDLQMEEYDDDTYGAYGGVDLDEHAPGAGGRANKRRLTAEQVRALERSFEEEKRKLEPERKSELARRLGMAPRQVAVWFQNRRARWKTKQLERDFDALRAAHDRLLAGRDALLADNESLRLQVISLTEELQAKASSPVSEPEDHTTASGMVHAGASAPPALANQPKESCDACAVETNAGAGAAGAPAMGIAGSSPESHSCFADARSPPSSSDDDCGGAASSEGGCAFFLPDGAMLEAVAAVERESEAEAAAQLNYWAWFWN